MKLNKDCIRDILLYVEEHCVYEDDKRFGHRLHEVTFNELWDKWGRTFFVNFYV